MMDIAIIIVAWKVKEKLRANLEALLPSLINLRAEVFVVDNNSGDGTVEMIKAEFPSVHLIANQENVGFARANNQALKVAQADFVLLLNPDMRVFPETVSQMLAWARNHPSAVVSACRLESENGALIRHVRRFPRLADQLAVVLKLPHLFPGVLNNYLYKNFNYESEARVDSIRGAFFFINVAAWQKISANQDLLLDERYFIWFEEVDFCRQVYQKGGEVWYTPATHCLDYIGQSFNQLGTGLKQRYFQNSMLKYFQKWHAHWQVIILKTAWPLGRMLAKIFS